VNFHHLGIFVKSIEEGKRLLGETIPIREWDRTFEDAGLHVSVCFGMDASGIRYELVAPFGEPNPVSGVLSSGRNILNHVAYTVGDMESAMKMLRSAGAIPMGAPRPAVAFGGANVAFFLTSIGIIIELVEGDGSYA
jgi:methylmalonyl-CoA/ethylmalonyl-CoA epimerase